MSAEIIQGDCLEVLKTLPDKLAALVVTSPPYNLKKKWWNCGANGCLKDVAKKFTTRWYPDEVPENEYQDQQRRMIRECLRIAPCVAYNHKVRYAHKRCGRAFHPMEWLSEFPLWVEIIWDRGGGITFNSRRPIVADERVFVLGRPRAWHKRGLTTVWRIPPDSGRDAHPCAFPRELVARLILSFTDEGDTIVDPYAGSGTTGAVATAHERNFLGIELDPAYCEIARRRIAAVNPLFSHKEHI